MGPLGVEGARDARERVVHLLDGLAHGEAAEGEAVKARLQGRELLGVGAAQIGERASLDDPEERLERGARGREGALRPARRLLHGSLEDPSILRRSLRASGNAHVELHLDVRADEPLDANRFLGRQVHLGPVEVRAEREAVLRRRDERLAALASGGERECLEASRVGQHRVGPARELVEPSLAGDRLGAGAQPQVVGVAEHNAGARGRDLVGREGLHAPLRTDGHERRQQDLRVRRREDAGARMSVGRLHAKREAGGPRGRHVAGDTSIASP